MAKKSKKTQKPVDVLVNFVVDASGSMIPQTADTVAGFNEFLQDQKSLDGACFLSVITFNSRVNAPFAGADVQEVDELGTPGNPYTPGGGTALADAVGAAITGSDGWLSAHPDFDGEVITVIWTDGGENSSQQFNIPAVNSMIEERQERGWNFTFLGAGEGWRSAQQFTAIPVQNVQVYANSSANTVSSYSNVSKSLLATRSVGAAFNVAAVDNG